MTSPTTDPTTDPAHDRPDDDDRDLRERLRRSDPLATRAARLDPASLEVLMTEMTRPRTETAEPAPAPPSRRPRWLVPAVAGAAAAAVAAVAFSGVLTPDPVPAPDTAGPAVTLAVPNLDPATSMCLAISPEVLAPAQLAFDGVVTRVDGDAATITPSRWYRGERAGTVEVTVPPEVDAALVGAPRFELGKRYLVSGGDGQVGLCGASGEYSTQLESLYRTAFAG